MMADLDFEEESKVTLKNGVYAGIVVLLVMLSSGTTYYLEATGDYKICNDGGWDLLNTGQYECVSRGITEWCYELSEPNIDGIQTRCYIGHVIHQEPESENDIDYATKINGSWQTRQIKDGLVEVWHKQYIVNITELESEKTKLESDILTAKTTMDTCPNDKYYMECVDEAWNEQVIKEIEIEQINEKIELVK